MSVFVVTFKHYPLHHSKERECHRITTRLTLSHAFSHKGNPVTRFIIWTDTLPTSYMKSPSEKHVFVTLLGALVGDKLSASLSGKQYGFSPGPPHNKVHRQHLAAFLEDPQGYLEFF